MNKLAKCLMLVLVLAGMGCGLVLLDEPARETRSAPSLVDRTPGRYVAALPTLQPAALADWRRLTSGYPVPKNAGFTVDRAALSWLPREFALEEGDAILRIDGEAITSTDQLIDAVSGSSEGSAVEFQIRLAGTGEDVSYSVAR